MKNFKEKDLNKIVRFYNTKGWVKIPGLLDKKELNSIKKKN